VSECLVIAMCDDNVERLPEVHSNQINYVVRSLDLCIGSEQAGESESNMLT